MCKNMQPSDNFEELSKSVIQYLLRDTDAEIIKTRSKKDGGYDVIVECRDGALRQCAFFECKLRKGNLNLRDIAANVIIAFNHGALSFVAITNHDFTQQTGNELLDFCQHTVLNIKIIVGEEIKQLIEKCGDPIADELCAYLDIKKTQRKDDFQALRINFDKNLLSQLFSQTNHKNKMVEPLIEQLFLNEIESISSSLCMGSLVVVYGYIGVGKRDIIQAAILKTNKRAITIEATLHKTKDLVILDLLAQIWGIPTTNIFSLFSRNDVESITQVVGDKYINEETIKILKALLNDDFADSRATARQNALLCDYIASLIVLHKKDVGYVLYIQKLQYACKEIYDFLIYFIKYLAKSSIGCVISYQEPEYELQTGENPIEKLRHIHGYEEYHINPLTEETAIKYIKSIYPNISLHIAKLIVSKVGVRLYNLTHMLKNLIPDNSFILSDSKKLSQKLQCITPNNVSNVVSYILPQHQCVCPALFETCYILDCRVPVEICLLLGISTYTLENLVQAGLFQYNHELITAQNEFVYNWIMNAYSDTSLTIKFRAKKLLDLLNQQILPYNSERISLYRILNRNEEALLLLDEDIISMSREKQYSILRRELVLAINISHSTRQYEKEAYYLIILLDIITIQKELGTSKAEEYILLLENCLRKKYIPESYKIALSFFKLKRAFKLGNYTEDADNSIQIGRQYYDACISRKIFNNNGDWLGRVCGCYALLVKETLGNEPALEIFSNALKMLPDSFELRREYYSHIACMNLYESPLCAFEYYQKIIELFENEAPDSAALPFHEYGDLAMCQLIAGNLEYALDLVDEAIEICQSNGLSDEEGRCFNIRGCVEWCMGNLQLAEEDFLEATSIMCDSGYLHYAWRSQMNLLQLSLLTGNYSTERISMLHNLYTDFGDLLKGKIRSLVQYDTISFRKTREYHALLVLGVLWNKIGECTDSYKKISSDFALGKHNEIYRDDVKAFISGNYTFIPSPYLKNGYIYLVG